MAEQIQQKTVNSFVKGLITEASPLTFPENASVDELNMALERTGVRKRRKGIEYEENNVFSSFTFGANELVHTEDWKNVGNIGSLEFLVVQVANILHFYDKSSVPVSAGRKSFTINLNNFASNLGENTAQHRVDVTSIDGNLVVVSNAVEPFWISFDPEADSITASQITPRVRDFEWQGNTASYFFPEQTADVSDERKYDTFNAGWPLLKEDYGVLKGFLNKKSAFPPLTHSWFVGKVPDSNRVSGERFEPNAWFSVEGGNSLSGNGHYILDLFRKNRTDALEGRKRTGGITINLPTEVEPTRFTTVTTFAGRAWFSGLASQKNSSKVFFSRVIQDITEVGDFFQVGDPTSEDDPDLVDSDGGVISIPEAANIRALFTFGDKVLVFAENGVWEIGGIDSVFKATEFFVRRVTAADGLFNRAALVDAEGAPVWWSTNGIFTLSTEQISQSSIGQNISEGTIQTFWDNIGPEQRSRAVGIFDDINKQVLWLYSNDAGTDFKYNRVLLLDLTLQAFFPWEFKDKDVDTPYVVGMGFFSGFGVGDTEFNVTSSDGSNNVVSSGGTNNVVATIFEQKVDGPTEVRFLVRDTSNNRMTVATITNSEFKDWGTEDFESYAVAAYDFGGDMTRRKNNIYVTAYFNLTETGFVNEGSGSFSFQNPSSCFLEAFWDLQRSSSSRQQVYRHLRPIIVDSGDLNSFDYPFNHIVTRNKIRGRGRVLKLRFESETGKDFQLQGYEVINAAPRSV